MSAVDARTVTVQEAIRRVTLALKCDRPLFFSSNSISPLILKEPRPLL